MPVSRSISASASAPNAPQRGDLLVPRDDLLVALADPRFGRDQHRAEQRGIVGKLGLDQHELSESAPTPFVNRRSAVRSGDVRHGHVASPSLPEQPLVRRSASSRRPGPRAVGTRPARAALRQAQKSPGHQPQPGAVPPHQFYPVRSPRSEHVHHTRERVAPYSALTSAASESAPLRKSTGLVATMTRASVPGPIIAPSSARRSPPRSRPHPRRARSSPRRHRSPARPQRPRGACAATAFGRGRYRQRRLDHRR